MWTRPKSEVNNFYHFYWNIFKFLNWWQYHTHAIYIERYSCSPDFIHLNFIQNLRSSNHTINNRIYFFFTTGLIGCSMCFSGEVASCLILVCSFLFRFNHSPSLFEFAVKSSRNSMTETSIECGYLTNISSQTHGITYEF